MSRSVVVDASFALKWVLPERYSPRAVELLREWASQEVSIFVPALFVYEVADVFRQYVSRDLLVPHYAAQRLREFLGLFPVLEHDPGLAVRAVEVAHELGEEHAYDSQYTALAEREDADFWTADRQYWNVARERFSFVHWVGE